MTKRYFAFAAMFLLACLMKPVQSFEGDVLMFSQKVCAGEERKSCFFDSDCGFYGKCITDCNENNIDDGKDISSGNYQDLNGNSIPDACEMKDDICSRPLKYWNRHTPIWPYDYDKMPLLCGNPWNEIVSESQKNLKSGHKTLLRQFISTNLIVDSFNFKQGLNQPISELLGNVESCFNDAIEILNDFCFDGLDEDTEYVEERNLAFSCAELLAEYNEGMLRSMACPGHDTSYTADEAEETAYGIYRVLVENNIEPRPESIIYQQDSVKKASTLEYVGIITVCVFASLVAVYGVFIAVRKWKRKRYELGKYDKVPVVDQGLIVEEL